MTVFTWSLDARLRLPETQFLPEDIGSNPIALETVFTWYLLMLDLTQLRDRRLCFNDPEDRIHCLSGTSCLKLRHLICALGRYKSRKEATESGRCSYLLSRICQARTFLLRRSKLPQSPGVLHRMPPKVCYLTPNCSTL